MIFAALLVLPWWQVAPAYLLVGVVWALAYLPRSIALQARAYKAWRDKLTGGRPLGEVLGPETAKKRGVSPEVFLTSRDDQPFSARCIFTGFIVNIAFWPLRIIEKLAFDILRSTFIWFFELLGDIWNRVIVPLFRAIGRSLRALGRAIRSVFRWMGRTIRTVFRWIGHALDAIWDNLVAPVWRAMHRCVRALWTDILVPAYTWAYRYVTTVYKSIIQRANREAIADLAALNNVTPKDLAK